MTNGILHSLGWRRNRRIQRFFEAEQSAPQEWTETQDAVGSIWWHERITILADKVLSFSDSVPACTEKVAFKETKILYQRIPTRPAPKIAIKDAWRVEQGKLSSSG